MTKKKFPSIEDKEKFIG